MEKKNFHEVFKGANPLGMQYFLRHSLQPRRLELVFFFPSAIDLLEKTLELDSDKRITASQALAHPYLAQYADPTDEPTSPPYDQTFEDFDLPLDQWKGKGRGNNSCNRLYTRNFTGTEYVWNEVQNFRPQQQPGHVM